MLTIFLGTKCWLNYFTPGQQIQKKTDQQTITQLTSGKWHSVDLTNKNIKSR